jgi:ankyrin repeat protein
MFREVNYIRLLHAVQRLWNTDRDTILNLSSSSGGYSQVLNYALDNGIDREGRNLALQTATRHGQVEIVEILLDHGADDTRGLMKRAALKGHVGVVQLLQERGIHDHSAIYSAVESNQLDVVKLLFKRDIDDHILNIAARNGRTDILNFLLDHGFSIQAHYTVRRSRPDSLYDPLVDAVRGNHVQTARLLLERGSSVQNVRKNPTKDPEMMKLLHDFQPTLRGK